MSADFWAGYLSGAAGILLGNPLDLVKVRLQAGARGSALLPEVSSSSLSSSPSSSSSSLRAATAAFATGTAAPILGYGALNALLFVSYRQAEQGLQGTPVGGSPAATAWLAGAVAGLATWVVSTPTELVKCRVQVGATLPSSTLPSSSPSSILPSSPSSSSASPPSTSSTSSPSSLAVARHIYHHHGLPGFFLGGSVTALRDSIGYGFYFWSYQLATDAWRARYGDTTAGTLLCGGLAGVVTWASVFPLDVIKTRVQGGVLTPESSPLLPGRVSTLAVARQAYRVDGLGVFFRGLGVCSARAFFVNAVQWAVYEWAMREMQAFA